MSESSRTAERTDEQLLAAIHELADKMDALHGEMRRLTSPTLPALGAPGWDDDQPDSPSHPWLSSLEPPVRRRPAVPRIVLEALFVCAVAAAAALADLRAIVIAAVMTGAWLLVAVTELTTSRVEARREELLAMPARHPAQEPRHADPAWFVPPVEQTLLDNAGIPEAATGITKLPPPQDDLDVTIDHPAKD